MKWNTECRFFNEDFACDTLVSESIKSCEECKFSSKYDKKILIIKLGALGDVIRTTSILEAIKEKYPESKIYWLVEDKYGEGKQLLKSNPNIDKVLVYNLDTILRLEQESFDIVYSLETSIPGTLIANKVKAKEKYGYFFDQGSTNCFNKPALEYLETVFLQHVKLKNRKTYQELIFQASELEYKKQKIPFELSEEDRKYAENFKRSNNLKESSRILGINFGSGNRWKSKAWNREKLIELISKTSKEYQILFLVGPDEKQALKELQEKLEKHGIKTLSNNPDNSVSEFASIVNLCSKVITTDSFGLHISIALSKPTIALFFSTPPGEIEDYGVSRKIVSPLLEKYFFSNSYNEELANSISVEEVLKALASLE